jgi:hypothetical protein
MSELAAEEEQGRLNEAENFKPGSRDYDYGKDDHICHQRREE